MIAKLHLVAFTILISTQILLGQKSDTTKTLNLDEIQIKDNYSKNNIVKRTLRRTHP